MMSASCQTKVHKGLRFMMFTWILLMLEIQVQKRNTCGRWEVFCTLPIELNNWSWWDKIVNEAHTYGQQFSDVDYLIMQECKQIFMSKSYRLRGNLSLEHLCISMTLELFQSICDWFPEWLNNPEGLCGYDIDSLTTFRHRKMGEQSDITSKNLVG